MSWPDVFLTGDDRLLAFRMRMATAYGYTLSDIARGRCLRSRATYDRWWRQGCRVIAIGLESRRQKLIDELARQLAA